MTRRCPAGEVDPCGGHWLAIGGALRRLAPCRRPHVLPRGGVAQLVEHMTENHGVDSSILSPATIKPLHIVREHRPAAS